MKVISWKNSGEQIKEIIKLLKKGGVIVFPTETAYGLATDPMNKKAVEKIFKIKKRKKEKALPLIASSIFQVKKYCKINKQELNIISKKWPGPYTIILKRKNINDGLCFDINSYAVRVSSCKVAVKLARSLGRPITSTSANISGKDPIYNINTLIKEFKNNKDKPDLVINYGNLPNKRVSRIIKIKDNKIKYLR